jgi:hypothetical protein
VFANFGASLYAVGDQSIHLGSLPGSIRAGAGGLSFALADDVTLSLHWQEDERGGECGRQAREDTDAGPLQAGEVLVVVYRFDGKQRKKCVRTYAEARTLHGKLTSSVAEGTHRETSPQTLEA